MDVVLSDMAPEMSGIRISDQAKALYLMELAKAFAMSFLVSGGIFVVKGFHGAGFDEYLKQLRQDAHKVSIHKPPASRNSSREVYLLAWF